MLPTHGAVTSVFHLANAMRHTRHTDIGAWVVAASSRNSFLAAAIDHRPAAELLVDAGLTRPGTVLMPSTKLKALSRQADRPTLIAIADLLLEIAPPPWLPVSVVEDEVRYEFIPSADLESLDWLHPELPQLLLSAASRALERADDIALGLGRAAELTIFAALDQTNASPIHVSEISDRFGYDIETVRGSVRRWEVKGCTDGTAGKFHLSRNEFNQCRKYPNEWRLIQVKFAPGALTAKHLTSSHVSALRELPASEIVELAPRETDEFYWETSARMQPPARAWIASSLVVPSDFQLPSIHELGKQALEMRATSLSIRT